MRLLQIPYFRLLHSWFCFKRTPVFALRLNIIKLQLFTSVRQSALVAEKRSDIYDIFFVIRTFWNFYWHSWELAVLDLFLAVGDASLPEQQPQGGAFSSPEREKNSVSRSSCWLLACCLAELESLDTEVTILIVFSLDTWTLLFSSPYDWKPLGCNAQKFRALSER